MIDNDALRIGFFQPFLSFILLFLFNSSYLFSVLIYSFSSPCCPSLLSLYFHSLSRLHLQLGVACGVNICFAIRFSQYCAIIHTSIKTLTLVNSLQCPFAGILWSFTLGLMNVSGTPQSALEENLVDCVGSNVSESNCYIIN